jgi:membrane protease YdiL (CAAX protease family)
VLLVTLVNLAMGVTAYVRRKAGRTLLAPRWSLLDLYFGVQALFALFLIGSIPLVVVGGLIGVADLYSTKSLIYIVFPSILLQDALFFLVPTAWINLRYRLPLRAIGLPPVPRRRDVFMGILLGFFGMFVSGLIGAGATALAHQFQSIGWVKAAISTDESNAVAEIQRMLPHFGLGGLILAVVGVGIAAPLGEEMVFRGWAFNIFKRRLGLAPGIFLSALLFTLPHGYGLGLLPVFLLGMLLAWVYHNTGSLWVTVIMHATNNTVQVLLAFFFPALMRGH